ncbi:MAG: sigma-70 family RNA polymerase sigma factor [Myxococcales bacterium]|nr:sigma-70 family RNA polymerase sigma factor [Myxococcales bacterium]
MVELLEHTEWVRGLATRLVRDDADDAAQDVWLAALRSPPDSNRPARPWLARVLQNAARKRFRDESTRRDYETAAPQPDAETSPEALVGRVQLQQLLVELVLGLDEPFRQTLLLRFFEGKSSAEIAEAFGVPAGTVRWRLKEGLERVRTALDARHHGDRKAWLLSCAPLLLPPAGPWLTAGVALMEKKVRVSIVVVIVMLVGLLAGWSSSERPGADARATTPPVERVAAPSSALPVATSVPSVVRVEPALAAPSASPVSPMLAAPVVEPSPLALVPQPSAPTITAPATPSGGLDGGVRYPLDKDGIRAAVKSAVPDVKDCYESWLAMNPALGGSLIVKLTIDTDDGVEGRVTRLSLDDGGMGNVAFEGCALSSLSDLRFEPPLDGPMNVTYPLLFSSTGAGH